MVGGMAVRAQHDEVLDVRAVESDRSMDEIVDRRLSVWNAKANRARHPPRFTRRDLVGGQRAARAIVPPRRAGGFGDVSLACDLLGRAEIGRASCRERG